MYMYVFSYFYADGMYNMYIIRISIILQHEWKIYLKNYGFLYFCQKIS